MIDQYRQIDMEPTLDDLTADYAPDLSKASPEDIELAVKLTKIRRDKHGGKPPYNKGDSSWI